MFYVYLETDGARALLVTTLDLLSAQFFAAKFSQHRAGTVAVYAGATGQPRKPLVVFEDGILRPEGPGAAVTSPVPGVTSVNACE